MPKSIKENGRGSFKNIEKYLLDNRHGIFKDKDLKKIGNYGIKAFEKNTPRDSGKTAKSWSYTIDFNDKGTVINFNNDNIQNGLNIAILVDVGHATAHGKWVEGVHYIDEVVNDICEYINNYK